ncbi:hypothetical protein [Psychroserpens jangbogonensis]|uniref:hypothetical protein n=1 Tax=Psychroserpens jangbogonensis TaxID=1484460 RepID=UPI00053ECC3B|nr:hypothetical protein [Psychroserpens jangbogonensis]
MNLIDNWEGYYEYGEGYPLPQFGQRVKISVNLQGNNDSFIGTVKEDNSEHSVPLEGKIKGFSENDFISFIKKYPKIPRLKNFGSSEKVMDDGQLEIEHYGYIDSAFDSIYGTWSITDNVPVDNDDYPDTSYGIWLLKRVK